LEFVTAEIPMVLTVTHVTVKQGHVLFLLLLIEAMDYAQMLLSFAPVAELV
jgi:hypothetical protein